MEEPLTEEELQLLWMREKVEQQQACLGSMEELPEDYEVESADRLSTRVQ